MNSLLKMYSKQRDKAFIRQDGERFLFWCARVAECLELMEARQQNA